MYGGAKATDGLTPAFRFAMSNVEVAPATHGFEHGAQGFEHGAHGFEHGG